MVALGIHHVSECTIMPQHILEESQQPCYLTPWDLSALSIDYIQTGLLFTKPQHIPVQTIIDQLKNSLATTLTHFFHLSGRLVTKKDLSLDPPHSYCILLDCTDARGVKFIHAVSHATISDILSPDDVPPFVESLFALHRPNSYDGHTLPLLAIQITELLDGIFIGCSFNHAVGDGTSFWHFFNAWSQVCRSTVRNDEQIQSISRPPIMKRWFINDKNHVINLPFSDPDEFIERYTPQPYRERIFHFTSESIAHLKAKANTDIHSTRNEISSFQAVAALVWRAVARARGSLADQVTTCMFPVDNRGRLEPPLSKEYFGNCILVPFVTTTVGELLSNDLSWAAWIFHKKIADHTDIEVRHTLQLLTKVPHVGQFGPLLVGQDFLMFGMSPRFDVYSNDFGWGAPVAVRSGYGIKFDGKVTWYPGREGGGSMDLEICLFPKSMSALELDEEFMKSVSAGTYTPTV